MERLKDCQQMASAVKSVRDRRLTLQRSAVFPNQHCSDDAGNKHCLFMESRMFGIRMKDLQGLPYQFTVRNCIQHTFSVAKGRAGYVSFDCKQNFNVDETAVATVLNKRLKVISCSGKKSVVSSYSSERGTVITAAECYSAPGQYIPPLMIFPRARHNSELVEHAPPDTV
ncbi:hypothetical protein PR048_028872 [Dryococelus australis]|uniref:Uncharacterized protein n=1 Tax=Dryococelus australis TaxID=614101 RepID=A0ABQ9GEH9_9NEOP|nr:hypothetical protein PR048_028872 [Dryococelus australis]